MHAWHTRRASIPPVSPRGLAAVRHASWKRTRRQHQRRASRCLGPDPLHALPPRLAQLARRRGSFSKSLLLRREVLRLKLKLGSQPGPRVRLCTAHLARHANLVSEFRRLQPRSTLRANHPTGPFPRNCLPASLGLCEARPGDPLHLVSDMQADQCQMELRCGFSTSAMLLT